MACFIYDGVDYSSTLDVAEVAMSAIPSASADLRYAAGRDGAALAGNVLEPLEITVKARLATASIDPRDIQRAWSQVAAQMRKSQPRPLYLTSDVYRLAVLTGEPALDFKTYSAEAELTFLCPDPVAYGDSRTVTVPSGGSVTFSVGGNYPAKPVITANSAARNSTSEVWGLRLDNADYVHVETGSNSGRRVVVDCEQRTCTLVYATHMITTDSDWLELSPGSHTLMMDYGTGVATVAFKERWL